MGFEVMDFWGLVGLVGCYIYCGFCEFVCGLNCEFLKIEMVKLVDKVFEGCWMYFFIVVEDGFDLFKVEFG